MAVSDTEREKSMMTEPEDPRMGLFVKIDSMARSRLVTGAFRRVDRAKFIPEGCDLSLAYKDEALDLGEKGASISQPSLSALMVDCLSLTGIEKVLEIGTASGYLAAALSQCAAEVHTVEYNENLGQVAGERLKKLGYDNVRVHCADGVAGLPKYAPYDGIIVTAGANSIPKAFIEQLALSGRLVIPVGRDPKYQQLLVGIKYPHGFLVKPELEEVVFYPLMSRRLGGWTEDSIREAKAFKKMMYLESARLQHGLSEEDVIKEQAGKMKVPPESFDLDEFIGNLRFPEQAWGQFEEYLRLSKGGS